MRRGHAPARERQFADAVRGIADNGSAVVRKMPGIGGKLPVLSRIARVSAMIAAWPLVRLYKLHIAVQYGVGAVENRAFEISHQG